MSEWGPWIEHDGKHTPANGTIVQIEYANGLLLVGVVGDRPKTGKELGVPIYYGETFASSWIWGEWGLSVPIIRYRIRKPRGLTILENLIADLPVPVGPKVDAE